MPWSGGNDLHVSSAQRKLPPSFHQASPCQGITHHLSGLNSNALTAYSLNVNRSPERDGGLAHTTKCDTLMLHMHKVDSTTFYINVNIEQLVRQYFLKEYLVRVLSLSFLMRLNTFVATHKDHTESMRVITVYRDWFVERFRLALELNSLVRVSRRVGEW